jgi:hypothetical protein
MAKHQDGPGLKNDRGPAGKHDDFSKHVGSLANGKEDNPSHKDHGITGNGNHSPLPSHNPVAGHNPVPSHNPVAPSQPHPSKGKGR